jgi:hypothetical protein
MSPPFHQTSIANFEVIGIPRRDKRRLFRAMGAEGRHGYGTTDVITMRIGMTSSTSLDL